MARHDGSTHLARESARPAERARSAAHPGTVSHLRGAGNRAVAGVLATGAPLRSVGQPVLQRAHVDIPTTVTAFQNQTALTGGESGDAAVSETGQFYWTKTILAHLKTRLPVLKAAVAALPNPDVTTPMVDWIGTVINQWPLGGTEGWAVTIRKFLASGRKVAPAAKPAFDLIAVLLKPCPARGATPKDQGEAMWKSLWNEADKTNAQPNLDRFHNLSSLGAVWTWENEACGFTGNRVANRYQAKGGAKSINPDAKRAKGTAIWATLSASGRRDMREVSPGFRLGDVLVQSGVAGLVPKMKAAIDDGWVLHARVLSGIDYAHGEFIPKGRPPPPARLGAPPQEHSIMVIAFDGNTFAFWDPDSVSSNAFGPGFGALSFDPVAGRFSTAASDADLPVDAKGNHAGGGGHRYQVITVSSQ